MITFALARTLIVLVHLDTSAHKRIALVIEEFEPHFRWYVVHILSVVAVGLVEPLIHGQGALCML